MVPKFSFKHYGGWFNIFHYFRRMQVIVVTTEEPKQVTDLGFTVRHCGPAVSSQTGRSTCSHLNSHWSTVKNNVTKIIRIILHRCPSWINPLFLVLRGTSSCEQAYFFTIRNPANLMETARSDLPSKNCRLPCVRFMSQ